MFRAETRLYLQEKYDAAMTRISRNKIRELELGNLRITIYERRRGRWLTLRTPHSESSIVGKAHDIIYSYDPQSDEMERVRFGNLAKAPQNSMIMRNPPSRGESLYIPNRPKV